MSDEELVGRVRAGDVSSFEVLIKRYQRLVFGVALSSLRNADDAKDVCQDVFIRAFSRLGQLADGSRFGAWLRQITINECRAWAAKQHPHRTLYENSAAKDPRRLAEDRAVLSAALDAIDEQSRLSVVLFYLHAHSIREIASLLDVPETTIKSRLRNARAKLRKEMEDRLERELGKEPLPDDFAERVARMIKAVEQGDEEMTRGLLREDPRLVTARDERGVHTALHIAAESGNAALVELLLANGADPNALEPGDNATPLHFAAERGWMEVVRQLVAAGTDLNWDQDVHEGGPLGWALMFGTNQFEVAHYLIQHGARISLFPAIALGRLDLVEAMVAEDPKLVHKRRSECDGRRTAIEFATEKRQFEIGRFLAEHTPEITLSEGAGLGLTELTRSRIPGGDLGDALYTSVEASQLETARILLAAGADPNTTRFGRSPIFACLDNEPMARLLLEFRADLEFKDPQWKSTALGWAVFFGQGASVKVALKLGAQVEEKLPGLADSGERGELRRWSTATPEEFREVAAILRRHLAEHGAS
jgi:RNA polymerase sigma-70 factor, ECF subfamily